FSIKATLPNTDRAEITDTASVGDVLTNRNVLVPVIRNGSITGIVKYADGTVVPHPVVTVSSRGTVGEENGTFTVDGVAVSSNPQNVVAHSPDGLREGHASVLVNHSGQPVYVEVTLNGIGTL